MDSILRQTWADFELIIIDDGSNDGSGDIIEQYASGDDRIIVRHQDNRGLTRSLNSAIELSRGRFIARQDADDISLERRLERQLQFLTENETFGIAGCDFEVIDDDDRFIATIRQSDHNRRLKQKLERKNPFAHGSLMMRTSLVKKLAGYNEYYTYSQDYDLLLRASAVTELHILPEVLYRWRFSRSGISRHYRDFYGRRARQNHIRRKLGQPEDHSPPVILSRRTDSYTYEIGMRYLAGHRMWPARKNFFLGLLQNPIRPRYWTSFLTSLLPAAIYRRLQRFRDDFP